MNDYDKERREWYLSHGICPHCGQNDLQREYKGNISTVLYAGRRKQRNSVNTTESKA